MQAACVQPRLVDGEVEANLDRALKLTERALESKPDLIALPELLATGYFTEDYRPYAEPLDGRTVTRLAALASESRAAIVAGLVTLNDRGDAQNSAVVIEPDGLVGVYSKAHLCVNPELHANESALFAPGTSLGLFDLAVGRVGVMICYDGHHPELPLALTLRGAGVLVWINNRSSIAPWEPAALAKFNHVPVVAVNRVGSSPLQPAGQPPRTFKGASAIADHTGEILASAADGREAVVVADVDLDAARARRRHDRVLNTLYSRRLDLYGQVLAQPAGWPLPPRRAG